MSLVESGVYGLVRHPAYTALMIGMWTTPTMVQPPPPPPPVYNGTYNPFTECWSSAIGLRLYSVYCVSREVLRGACTCERDGWMLPTLHGDNAFVHTSAN